MGRRRAEAKFHVCNRRSGPVRWEQTFEKARRALVDEAATVEERLAAVEDDLASMKEDNAQLFRALRLAAGVLARAAAEAATASS